MNQVRAALGWLQPDFGEQCLAVERDWLQPRLVRLGHAPNLVMSAISNAPAADVGLLLQQPTELSGPLRAEVAALPFAEHSFGTIAIQHVHEFCAEPEELFKECERVLIPGGRLLLSGFSPFAWSRWRGGGRFQVPPKWQSTGRIQRNWASLGLVTELSESLPWPESGVERWLRWPLLHTIQLLAARKQSPNFIPSQSLRMPAGVVTG